MVPPPSVLGRGSQSWSTTCFWPSTVGRSISYVIWYRRAESDAGTGVAVGVAKGVGVTLAVGEGGVVGVCVGTWVSVAGRVSVGMGVLVAPTVAVNGREVAPGRDRGLPDDWVA